MRWRNWINGCISSAHYALLVNGTSKGFFRAKRGLRQGNPLSLFLFTIVADTFSYLIARAEERNIIKRFKSGRNNVPVSHLQFADDTAIL